MYEALNKGLKVASGDFIGIVNSDDILHGQLALKNVAQAFGQFPTADGVYGDQIVLYDKWQRYKKVFQVDYGELLVSGKGTFVPHGCLFLRREFALSLGEYSTKYDYASDFDYILRALREGKIRYVPIPFSEFRVTLRVA